MFAAGLAIAIGTNAGALAQESDTAAVAPAATEQTAAPSDQPRRGRDRRRNAEAAEAEAPAAPAALTELPQTTVLAETVEAKITCRNIKPPGSRVVRRICGTEEQWAAANQRSSDDAEEGLRQFRNRAGVTGTPPSGPASLNTPAGL